MGLTLNICKCLYMFANSCVPQLGEGLEKRVHASSGRAGLAIWSPRREVLAVQVALRVYWPSLRNSGLNIDDTSLWIITFRCAIGLMQALCRL